MAFLKRANEAEKRRHEALSLFKGAGDDDDDEESSNSSTVKPAEREHTPPTKPAATSEATQAAMKAAATKLLIKQRQQESKALNVVKDDQGNVEADYSDPMEDEMPPPKAVAAKIKTPLKKDVVITRPPEFNKLLNLTPGPSALTNGLSLDPDQNQKQQQKKQQQETSTLFSFPPPTAVVASPEKKKPAATKKEESASAMIVESNAGQSNLSAATVPETPPPAAEPQAAAAEEKKKAPARRARVKTKSASKTATATAMDTQAETPATEAAPAEPEAAATEKKKPASKPKKKASSKKKQQPKKQKKEAPAPAPEAMDTESDSKNQEQPEAAATEEEPGVLKRIVNMFSGRGKSVSSPPAATAPVPSKAGVKLPKAKRHQKPAKKEALHAPFGGLGRPCYRRLARRAGIKRITELFYGEAFNEHLKPFLTEVVRRTVMITDHGHRKTVMETDVLHALKGMGFPMYSDRVMSGKYKAHMQGAIKKIKITLTPAEIKEVQEEGAKVEPVAATAEDSASA